MRPLVARLRYGDHAALVADQADPQSLVPASYAPQFLLEHDVMEGYRHLAAAADARRGVHGVSLRSSHAVSVSRIA